jgi:hypothetical protein
VTSSLRSHLNRATRDLGDLRAISRGPGPAARRYGRKVAYRHVNGHLRHVLRLMGL